MSPARPPRELRNNIYEYLTHDKTIRLTQRAGEALENVMLVTKAPIANVSSLGKQIRAEYRDVCFKNARLWVFARGLNLSPSSFKLKPGVPLELFKGALRWHVLLTYHGCLMDLNDEQKCQWYMDAIGSSETVEETLDRQWTPSTHVKGNLSTMLTALSKWGRNKKGLLVFDIKLAESRIEYLTRLHLLQPSTFVECNSDAHAPFAEAGNVTLSFGTRLPLCSRITDVAREGELRLKRDGTVYYTKPSRELMEWSLEPLPRCQADEG